MQVCPSPAKRGLSSKAVRDEQTTKRSVELSTVELFWLTAPRPHDLRRVVMQLSPECCDKFRLISLREGGRIVRPDANFHMD
jgi:hypothetical protein